MPLGAPPVGGRRRARSAPGVRTVKGIPDAMAAGEKALEPRSPQ